MVEYLIYIFMKELDYQIELLSLHIDYLNNNLRYPYITDETIKKRLEKTRNELYLAKNIRDAIKYELDENNEQSL